MEAAGEESMRVVEGAAVVYGGLYLRQYQDRPADFVRAIEECERTTQGCMLFDLVYVREYGWWDIL